MSGLMMSGAVGFSPRDEKNVVDGAALNLLTSPVRISAGRGLLRCDVRLDLHTVGVVDVHCGQPMGVGEQVVGVGVVVQDHPCATGLEHGEALLGPAGRAAAAEDDLAGDDRRVETTAQAQVAAGRRRVDQRQTVGAGRHRRTGERLASIGAISLAGIRIGRTEFDGALEEALLGARADRRDPRDVAGEPMVAAPGPLFPADVATQTPAFAANR